MYNYSLRPLVGSAKPERPNTRAACPHPLIFFRTTRTSCPIAAPMRPDMTCLARAACPVRHNSRPFALSRTCTQPPSRPNHWPNAPCSQDTGVSCALSADLQLAAPHFSVPMSCHHHSTRSGPCHTPNNLKRMQYETLECNVCMKQMKHLEHTVQHMCEIYSIQIKYLQLTT
jgi:hypothetical protein